MAWLYVLGIVLFAVVFLVLLALGANGGEAGDADAGEDSDDIKAYRWGDELHEFSYRHPWDDEI